MARISAAWVFLSYPSKGCEERPMPRRSGTTTVWVFANSAARGAHMSPVSPNPSDQDDPRAMSPDAHMKGDAVGLRSPACEMRGGNGLTSAGAPARPPGVPRSADADLEHSSCMAQRIEVLARADETLAGSSGAEIMISTRAQIFARAFPWRDRRHERCPTDPQIQSWAKTHVLRSQYVQPQTQPGLCIRFEHRRRALSNSDFILAMAASGLRPAS